MASGAPPPSHVLHSFGLPTDNETPQRLHGGQGTSYYIADAVLKPVDDPEETGFVLGIQDALLSKPNPAYRVARPLVCIGSKPSPYIVDNWCGTRFIAGSGEVQGRWAALIHASRAFHRDLASLVTSEPSFFQRRNHRWARAERLVFDEGYALSLIPQGRAPDGVHLVDDFVGVFERLVRLKQPLIDSPVGSLQKQLVHSDLSGNMLFPVPDQESKEEAPAIIDLSLYWRPVAWAEAVVVADGLLDCGEGGELVLLVGISVLRLQMLIRALLFRLVTWNIRIAGGERGRGHERYAGAFERAAGIVEGFMESGDGDID